MTKLLILDLDETIIHSTREWIGRPPAFEGGEIGFLFVRPGLQPFLESVHRKYRVAVWSAATDDYVNAVRRLVLNDCPLAFAWSRAHCDLNSQDDGAPVFVKNLDRVHAFGIALSSVVVVDDRPEALARHADNLVAIKPFYGDKNDDELSRLSGYLDRIGRCEDVRLIDKSSWR